MGSLFVQIALHKTICNASQSVNNHFFFSCHRGNMLKIYNVGNQLFNYIFNEQAKKRIREEQWQKNFLVANWNRIGFYIKKSISKWLLERNQLIDLCVWIGKWIGKLAFKLYCGVCVCVRMWVCLFCEFLLKETFR